MFKDGNLALKSFLILYKENKQLATWSLFNNTKIFAELKEEFRLSKSTRNLNKNIVENNGKHTNTHENHKQPLNSAVTSSYNGVEIDEKDKQQQKSTKIRNNNVTLDKNKK